MKDLISKISWREVRNALFGLTVVVGGLGLAFVTLYAHQVGNPRLAGAAAVASLVFVVLILLFVVPPLARNASREVAQIDFPIELTVGGFVFLGITAIVGFAAWNTGNNLLFLVLSFLLAAVAVSFFVNGSNLKKLEAKVRFPEAIFAGEPTVFFVALKNHKFLSGSFSITLALRGALTDDPFGGRKFQFVRPPARFARFFRLPLVRRIVGYFIYVGRKKEVEQQTEQLFPQRGRFIIKDFELSTKFPFGFWQQRRRLKVRETEIFVFPQINPLPAGVPAFAGQAGLFAANRRGAGQDLLGLREYQTSDDVRRIDWKATARTGNLIVREFAQDDEPRVTVFFDKQMLAPNQKPDKKLQAELNERFERGISQAAAVIWHFVNQKSNVRLIVNSAPGNFGADKAHLYESLRRLSTLEPELIEKIDDKPVFEFGKNDFSILVTANQSANQLAAADKILNY